MSCKVKTGYKYSLLIDTYDSFDFFGKLSNVQSSEASRKFWPFLGSDNKPLTLRHPKELLRWQHLTNNYVLNMNWNTQITSTIVKETQRFETLRLIGNLGLVEILCKVLDDFIQCWTILDDLG